MVVRRPRASRRATSHVATALVWPGVVWRWVILTWAGLTALAMLATRAYSHPLHTTLTEVTVAPDGGVQIVLRAFVDDFSAAIAGNTGTAPASVSIPTDTAAARYLARTVALTDAAGHSAPLAVVNIRRAGDLVWVTLRAPTLRSVSGARLANRVLFDRYNDQVNIVQTSIGGRRQTLLFTKRESAAKRI
jgi:hypothetical protein